MDQQQTRQEQQNNNIFAALFSDGTVAGSMPRGPVENAQGVYATSSTSTGLSPMSNPSLAGFDFLEGVLNMPGQSPSSQNAYNHQLMLEQRLKLNQLQQLQLQNQIIQQQLEMHMHGQGGVSQMESMGDRQKSHYIGLPTPMSSTELHAQPSPNTDFVSPMTLSTFDNAQFGHETQTQLPPPNLPLHPHHISNAHTAPANIVFNTNPPMPLPSPGEMDFDLSPLTSPWLEAYRQDPPHSGPSLNNKRAASPSQDDSTRYGRPRPSTTTLSAPGGRAKRGTKSASSTPLLRSVRSGNRKNNSTADVSGDSPSPVDLSMPPPAPPGHSDASPTPTSSTTTPTPQSEGMQNMLPATPASIMNLGHLGITNNLAPPAPNTQAIAGKSASRRRSSIANVPVIKKSVGPSLVSPGLKPILPAGNVAATSNLSAPMPSPIIRKTSHKAAEQKRRDSLKTAYDVLRGLLPPIPLPTDDGFGDEPILPGAMPPRGPPRGNVEGPNRGISKLQLLRCGNDYIGLLKGQVERRDGEMSKLRNEISRLRVLVGEDAWKEGGEELDLEKDLDDGEVGPWKRSGSAYDGDEGDEECGE
ncbi:hypothetical protein OF83DRAFT_1090897 [Amylostereum chailletii]|nr:hypothetical protein OF83DRAFT_1090897 [Amylostereum chailletii]